jgi:hypothetical protein
MSRERPSATRILITVVIVIVVTAVLLVAAWLALGLLAPRPTGVL